ncbi:MULTISPECIES: hypothetical protein [Sinorhizobium/Ensifer group]|jgi:hypothetical protein|uniref:hypothetical protein n=1 Tax=Sinorhizobium/Ensifer group TaxID=227292 RepID=UPI00070AB01D|nr:MULTISPECIES: hypothetical protein [Sinorhizobium/Ensifer group]KRD63634.1 hypothetical protein ASE60_30735 [Ensifer sp. Root278]KSV70447.1 hypothetical protein N183_28925 [Sinorhizobium sp. Sb3]KSV88265.1 hypothetical protein N184_30100 [Sinorhizobium sp. GL28]MBD9511094.1 hypothetical protein [Ensifer sp. ENS10]MBV7518166.1 hypothetical protein [Ensifer sp. ENS12]
MAKVVVIGVAGDDRLWMADLDAGTVTQIPTPTQGPLAAANDLRVNGGATVHKGVNLAVVAASSGSVSGGFMDG